MAIKVSGLNNFVKIETPDDIFYIRGDKLSIDFRTNSVILTDPGTDFHIEILFTDFQDGIGTPISTEATIATYLGGIAASGSGVEEAPSDGTQYARKNLGWEAVASSGGGNVYEWYNIYYIPIANQWVTSGLAYNTSWNTYTASVGTGTIATLDNLHLLNNVPFAHIKGNRTITNLRLSLRNCTLANGTCTLTGIGLVAYQLETKASSYPNIVSQTLLMEHTVSGLTSYTDYDFLAEFTSTSLVDEDIVVLYLKSSDTSKINMNIRLETS